MARKDLSRTVIEGGRYYHNSYLRRASHGVARARARQWLDRVHVDAGDADASAPTPGPRVPKRFRDKLAPALRWLTAQVGRPWAAVFSDLCARFDTRTVAGRHVVHDHMLRWVRAENDVRAWPRTELVIDARGILRRDPRASPEWQRKRRDVQTWADGRRAVLEFRGWWWYRFDVETICTAGWTCKQPQHITGYGPRLHVLRLVSESPLTRGEQRRLGRLPADLRAEIVIASDRLVWSR